MQTSNRILDDLARVANGAVSTLTGIKGELEAMIRHQLERIMADRDTVPREEFEAVKAMAAKARSQQEKLEKRVAALEARGVSDMGFIASQLGMFSYSGLTKAQMVALRSDYGIYGTDAGRMCVAALNDGNLSYVADAIAAVRTAH